MTPEVIPLECPGYCDVRIVRHNNGFTVEEHTLDATGELRWSELGSLSSKDYDWTNIDHRYNDIPPWVFFVVDHLFKLHKEEPK